MYIFFADIIVNDLDKNVNLKVLLNVEFIKFLSISNSK